MDAETTLASALEALGLRYTLHGAGPSLQAGFRYEVGPGAFLPFDAQVRSGILQFRVRAADAPAGLPELPRLLNEVNRRWHLGQVHVDASGALCASTGIRLAGAVPSVEHLHLAFRLLRRAAALLVRAPACFAGVADDSLSPVDVAFEERFAALFTDEFEALPPTDGAPLQTLARLLGRVGMPFTEQHAGRRMLTQRFFVDGARDRLADLFMIDPGLLCLRARFSAPTTAADPGAALLGMNRLNARFAIGNAVLDGARPVVQVSMPLRDTRLDEDLAHWLVDRAMAALAAVEREVALRD